MPLVSIVCVCACVVVLMFKVPQTGTDLSIISYVQKPKLTSKTEFESL